MSNPSTNAKKRKIETSFNLICNAAELGDTEELTRIVKSGTSISEYEGQYSAVMWLAKQGKHEAVNLLIDNFNASRNHAALGYALGGFIYEAYQQINLGACRNDVLRGFAMAGLVNEVNAMIKGGSEKWIAMLGYAELGNVVEANKWLAQTQTMHFY